jgi:NADPH2:quinone reductase
MRAVIIKEHGSPDTLTIEDIASPPYQDDEVLVQVHAIGINFPDLLVISGEYQILPPRPFVPGKDASGIVIAIGKNVTHCQVGDRVVVQVEHGAYAEQLVAPQDSCFVIPDSMSFEEAAAMSLVYQTAYFALIERAHFKPGERVLITGAGGGVGLAAVQIAKALGAIVFAGVRNDAHAQLAKDSGADHIIRLDTDNLRDALRQQVYAVTDNQGVDIVIDPVGGDTFDASLRALAWQGRSVVIGFAAGRIPTIKANYLLVKNIAVSGLQWSDYRDKVPHQVRQAQAILFDLYRQKKIKPMVMPALPLDDFAQALQLVKDGKVQGKVVLTTKQ